MTHQTQKPRSGIQLRRELFPFICRSTMDCSPYNQLKEAQVDMFRLWLDNFQICNVNSHHHNCSSIYSRDFLSLSYCLPHLLQDLFLFCLAVTVSSEMSTSAPVSVSLGEILSTLNGRHVHSIDQSIHQIMLLYERVH